MGVKFNPFTGNLDLIDATDADAIHDNVAGEINAITEKVSPVSADLVVIEDSEDSNNKKKVQVGNLPSGSTPAINDITDVTITTPADDEVLAYDNVSGKWINQTPAEAGLAVALHTHTESDISDLQSYLLNITGESLSDLSDATITAIASGEVLKWNGSAWINNTLAEAGISATGHSHTELDISDLAHYNSTNFDTDLATKSLDDILAGTTNKHFTATDELKLDGLVGIPSGGFTGQSLRKNSASDYAVAFSAYDGWEYTSQTWTYASASTFTVGTDVTSYLVSGTKISIEQSGITKYFYVIASSYSLPNTTVTIATNNDYTLANSIISNPKYSYVEMPFGFPDTFNISNTVSLSASGSMTVSGVTISEANFQIRGNRINYTILAEFTLGGTASNTVYVTGLQTGLTDASAKKRGATGIANTASETGLWYVTSGRLNFRLKNSGNWTTGAGKSIYGADLSFTYN